jgi:hypothetical protein
MKPAALICALAALAASPGTVETKFHALQIDAYPKGARIPFTDREFNTYLQSAIPTFIGPGIRNARIEMDAGGIVRGYADIDFLKLRQAEGEKPGWLMSQLLAGERPVAITVRLTSGHGKARVDVQRVAVSSLAIEGHALDMLISTFVLPSFPDVKVGKDFALAYHIDHFEFRPGLVTVVLSANRYN